MAVQRKPRRKLSKKQRAMYTRRRIVVAVAALTALVLMVFCVYSVARFAGAVSGAVSGAFGHGEASSIARGAAPSPKLTSGVQDCTAANTRLELSVKSQSVPVGGSLEWTASVIHDGADTCLIDASDSNRVLTITSGSETIWRSDVCPANPRQLLMAKGDKDIRGITWNTNANATLTECTDQSTWLNVNPGTYVGQLSLKSDPKVVSDQVSIIVG